MSWLYVTSPGPGEGKTAVAAALLRLLGPSSYRRVAQCEHPDAAFLAGFVGAPPNDALTVGAADPSVEPTDAPSIVEGEPPAPAGLATLAVVGYRGDGTVVAARALAEGANVVGIVLNAVPTAQRDLVARVVEPGLASLGLSVLGVLPEERALRAATVAELAAFLEGEVICAPEARGNLIESYMVGAMSDVSGVPYFNRKQNKAVVCGGNRIDVHMAALATPCRCIVATGGYDPDPVVLERADAEGVPIVRLVPDTVSTMDRISAFLRTVRFRHEAKVAPFVELFRRHVDLSPIERVLHAPAPAVGRASR
ncbi:MAG TPA: DRTGG domain-containing protein [Chloroflexota bacterium]|jgi:BioD-like phosphotransacetylase family protein